jgi:hypothetical protein
VPPHVTQQRGVVLTARLPLGPDEEESPAHGKVRDEDMDDGDEGDEEARRREIPEGVVHVRTDTRVLSGGRCCLLQVTGYG